MCLVPHGQRAAPSSRDETPTFPHLRGPEQWEAWEGPGWRGGGSSVTLCHVI